MNLIEAVKSVLSKYATFTGRARRSEYWYFSLAAFLCSLATPILSLISESLGSIVNTIITLGVIIPSLAVATRRLHDVGKSGWLLVISYVLVAIALGCIFAGIGYDNFVLLIHNQVPFDETQFNLPLLGIGGIAYFAVFCYGIYLLYLTCCDSQVGENQYGPNPKGEEEIADNSNY